MNDVVYLLAVYGAYLVWRENYLPWLLRMGREPFHRPSQAPPLAKQLERYIKTDWSAKPWKCPFCMPWIIGVAFSPFLVSRQLWVLLPFAAVAVTYLFDETVRYTRLDPGPRPSDS